MLVNTLRLVAVLAAVTVGTDLGPIDARASAAADEKKPAPDKANQLEGTIAAVDVTANKIRIISVTKKDGLKSETDQTLPVAADARITLAGEGKQGATVVKFADLKDGMRVVVVLTADKKTVTEIRAAKKVNAVTIGVRSVDAEKRTITTTMKDKTGVDRDEVYAVAANAPVVFADHGKGAGKQGTLADVRAGMGATLRLSEDGKSVVDIRVAAPKAQGVVKSVDAVKNAITITVGAKDKATDVTYELEKGATIVLDGKEAKLTEIQPKTPVELLLSSKNGVVGVRAGEKKSMK
jgi:hypothetical protein